MTEVDGTAIDMHLFSQEVADSAQSVILEQVANGVAVRMAVLYLLLTGRPWEGEREGA